MRISDPDFVNWISAHCRDSLSRGDTNREICVTEFAGRYERRAGLVLAIEGSPPKAIVLVDEGAQAVAFVTGGRSRSFRAWRWPGIWRELAAILEKHGLSVTGA